MIRTFGDATPRIAPSAFVEDSAQVIGDVELGEGASVWFNTVIRGDVNAVRIGARTNVQDLSLIHVLKDRFSTTLGDDVTVGHHVVLHGCAIGNRVLVGMGAVVLDGVQVGDDCVIAAGALLTPGTVIPAGSMVLGSPARVKRPISDAERAWLLTSAANYVGYAQAHRDSRERGR